MGLVHANITLGNPRKADLAAMETRALVDSDALLLCIPQHVAVQLGLDPVEYREVRTADGALHSCPYVGPVEVRFANRRCFVGALVLGDEVLLGAVPMEDLDVVISPGGRRLIVNPDSPNIPSTIVKSNTSRSTA